MKLPVSEQITFIYVNDLERSREFYEDLLGFDLVLDQGSCRIVQTAGNAYLGYCEKGGGEGSKPDLILTFVTSEVDGWYQKLRAGGVIPENPPQENELFRIYHFFAVDPDGYRLEFQQFLDPGWKGG